MLWELRTRFRHVDNVLIETQGDTEAEARALAEWYIDSLANPHIKFVQLRPIIVATTKGMKQALAGEYGDEPDAPAPAPPRPAARASSRPAPRNTTKNHRRGTNAADSKPTRSRGDETILDEMAGPGGRIGD